jgi:hypothetical protein
MVQRRKGGCKRCRTQDSQCSRVLCISILLICTISLYFDPYLASAEVVAAIPTTTSHSGGSDLCSHDDDDMVCK